MNLRTAKLVAGTSFVFFAVLFVLIDKPQLKQGVSFSVSARANDDSLLRLTTTHDEKYRLWTSLSDISPHIINTTLFLEDQWFYYHPGANPVSLVRAAATTYLGGQKMVGASTITMQLARLRYGIRTRSIKGKLYQIWKSILIELSYTKDEILEAYLNFAPYGGNIEGVGAASQIYFAKKAADLSLGEAFILSVLPQSPSRRSPYPGDKKFEEMDSARSDLIER